MKIRTWIVGLLAMVAWGCTSVAAAAGTSSVTDAEVAKERKAKCEITVSGAVVRPDRQVLEMCATTTLGEAIRLAGGFDRLANRRRVQIARYDENNQRILFYKDMRSKEGDGDGFVIQPGDAIYVLENVG